MTHSAHISEEEVACRCGCGWANMSQTTLQAGEMIRAWCNSRGKRELLAFHIDFSLSEEVAFAEMNTEYGLRITSGCRCPEHNKAVGGEEDSWHLPRLKIKDGWEVCQDTMHPWIKDAYYAHALDFQVVRREKVNEVISAIGGNAKVSGWTPWTLDPAATRAVVEFWEPIWTLGYMYLGEKVCEECGGKGGHMDLKRTDYTGDVPKLHYSPYTCPTCQGEGKIYWVHMDTREA